MEFAFEITDIRGSGLSRDVTVRLTNTGTGDAHNVWVKIEAFSQGSRININGQEYLVVDIGSVNLGQAVASKQTLSFGIMDTLNLLDHGVE